MHTSEPSASDLDRPAPALHELALVAIGLVTFVVVGGREPTARFVLLPFAGAIVCYATLLVLLRRQAGVLAQKLRWASSVAFLLWFYTAVYDLVPLVGVPLRDEGLLRADRFLFGETPGAWLASRAPSAVWEFFSAGYLTFEVYVVWAVFRAFRAPIARGRDFFNVVITTFVVGYVGYLLVPAVGPCRAYPELFVRAPSGGVCSRFTMWIVNHGSSVYDVFPSLHIAITLLLLDFDRRHARRYFWIALPMGVTTMISTVFLGYHYAVDVLAGALLFFVVRTLVGAQK